VRLYNVHLIVRPWHPVPYSSDDFSGLVEVMRVLWCGALRIVVTNRRRHHHQGFGCCSYSRVSVVQFGSDCQPPPPLFSARKRGSLETYLRRYPLSAAPWYVQLLIQNMRSLLHVGL
jgi:hypothetical protein